VVGSGGVGKSAFTIRFVQAYFVDKYDPTIEDSYRKQCSVDGESYILDVLDTAGQEEYRSFREQYMKNGDGFLCMYAINNRFSFDEANNFYKQILRVKDCDEFPCIFLANKCDLEESQRVVSIKEGQEFAERLKCKIFETSAKKNVNVDEAFYALVREVIKYQRKKCSTEAKNSGCCLIL